MNYYNEIRTLPRSSGCGMHTVQRVQVPQSKCQTRSIEDLPSVPEDLEGYRQCHFFAGIGGWPLGFGWLRLLALSKIPVWKNYNDHDKFGIRFPVSRRCLSSAGQHKSWTCRGAPVARFLPPHECQPTTVFGEQVASKDGREWICGVRADLEHMGYACGCVDMPAASVGAPHIRQRLWWVAHAKRTEQPRSFNQEGRPLGYSETSGLADAECSDGRTGYGTRRTEGGDLPQQGRQEGPTEPTGCRKTSGLATPMAGTPTQKGYNAAGNTDSSRKTVELAGWVIESDREGRSEGQSPSPASRYGSTPGQQVTLAGWTTPQSHDAQGQSNPERLKRHGQSTVAAT